MVFSLMSIAIQPQKLRSLGLDPKATRRLCRIESAPRIKSEGTPVGVGTW